jgi:hypothetical protein
MIKRAWFLVSILWSLLCLIAILGLGWNDPLVSRSACFSGSEISLGLAIIPWLMFPAANFIRHGFPKSPK